MECAVGQNSTLQLVHTFFILLPIPTGAWSSLIIGIILLGLAWRLQSDRSFREKKYVKQGKWINYTFFLRYCNVVTSIGKAVRIYILISLLAVYNWQTHVRLLIIQNTSVQIYIWISIIWNSSSYVTRAEDPRHFLSLLRFPLPSPVRSTLPLSHIYTCFDSLSRFPLVGLWQFNLLALSVSFFLSVFLSLSPLCDRERKSHLSIKIVLGSATRRPHSTARQKPSVRLVYLAHARTSTRKKAKIFPIQYIIDVASKVRKKSEKRRPEVKVSSSGLVSCAALSSGYPLSQVLSRAHARGESRLPIVRLLF